MFFACFVCQNQETETLKLQLSELEQALNTESQDKQQAINGNHTCL